MTQVQLSSRLVDIGRASVHELENHPVGGKLVDGTISSEDYALYLTQVVQQVRCSGPMLKDAGRALARRGRGALATLFDVKSAEEDGHDAWALRDLSNLGVDARAVTDAAPSAPVLAYVAWTRYAVEHEPLAIFGVAWTLEWFGSSRAGRAADNLVARGAIPGIESAVSFLRGHGDADTSHVEALAEALRDVRDPRDAEIVELSARLTARLYLGFFDRGWRL
jgi:pyrroloquinoline quinone (PQQ) biosynthesis protein C